MAAFEEQDYNKPFDLRIWGKLAPFLKPYTKRLAFITLLMLSAAAIDVLLPLLQRYAIDSFILRETTQGLWMFAGLYLLIILLQTAGVVIFARQSMVVEMGIGRDLKRASFVHLQTLGFSYYNVTPVGYLLARVMSDTNRIAGMIAWGVVDVFWALAYVAGVFVAMYLLHPGLALLVMTVVPAIALLTVYFQNKILHYNRQVRKLNSRITGAYNEGIMGAKTSKTLVIEESNNKSFAGLSGDMYNATVRSAMLNAVYIPTIMLFSSLATALVLARGGWLVMEQLLMVGTLSAFTTYAVSIFEPIQQLARVFADLISAQANIERIAGLLEHEPDITETPEVFARYGDSLHPRQENWEPLRGDIEFRDVSFRYPDGQDYVLEHFNLTIPAGTTVAIVGETGAGKSTLVNLACRFFEPTSGQILIDGRDYRERSQLWLHSNIGYGLQSPHLFSGTVRDNIRYGRLDATEEEIIAAAHSVSADTVVAKLENGYDSDVGEGGDRLSTGEKQMISFARAVLADPRIFVLDEATSSIDTHTEQLVQNAISQLLHSRTSFLIAHRLSTIRQADLILVVKDGRVVEQGRHRELLEQRGYYFTLYSRQFQEEEARKRLHKE